MKKRLLLINQSAGYLMEDICREFLNSGKYEEVILATGSPQNIKINDPRFRIDPITKYDRRSIIKRTWSWTLGLLQLIIKIWARYRKADLFLVSNPPTISFLPLFCKNRFSILIYDVYPDGLVPGFINSDNPIFKVWSKANRRLYTKASHVYTITEGMAMSIGAYCDMDKIEIVPLWYCSNITQIPKKQNPFISEHHLYNKFVLMFSGNMGKGANLEFLLDIAQELKNLDSFRVVIIGDGMMKQWVLEQKESRKLENVLVLPYQPVESISLSLSAADMFYVALKGKGSNVCIPSKTYNCFAVGRPVLCITDKGTALHRMVTQNGIGLIYDSFDLKSATGELRQIIKNGDSGVFNSNILKARDNYTNRNAKLFRID